MESVNREQELRLLEEWWARRGAGSTRLRWELERKARVLPRVRPDLRYAVAAREEVSGDGDVLRITAAHIFS